VCAILEILIIFSRLNVHCYVLDLTISQFLSELGTTQEELVAAAPSRFAANARGNEHAHAAGPSCVLWFETDLCVEGTECAQSARISS